MLQINLYEVHHLVPVPQGYESGQYKFFSCSLRFEARSQAFDYRWPLDEAAVLFLLSPSDLCNSSVAFVLFVQSGVRPHRPADNKYLFSPILLYIFYALGILGSIYTSTHLLVNLCKQKIVHQYTTEKMPVRIVAVKKNWLCAI